MRILLLEDDRLFCETLQEFLEESGFNVDCVFDPYSAYDLAYEYSYDLYIFDINLPFEDGLSALHSLRESGDNTPTIFITSRDDRESLLTGFKVGADDYLKKPIDLDELILRVEAILKRKRSKSIVKYGNIEIDFDKSRIYRDGKEQPLTQKPFKLLNYFIKNQNRIVKYEEIYDNVWGGENTSYVALRVYISELKKYFGKAIENIRGVGYLFDSSKIE